MFTRNCRRRLSAVPAPAQMEVLEDRQLLSGTTCDGMQDLQVTIEVRFMTVSDNFLHRIGIDFDTNVAESEQFDRPLFEKILEDPAAPTRQPEIQPDFPSLIDLIKDQVGDDETAESSEVPPLGNLNLIVTHTQVARDQLAKLLEELRRLQDPQVTIEARFLTLPDNFFDRIGVDFDVDIRDDLNATTSTFVVTDLDVPFGPGTFELGHPDFGGYDPNAGLQVGLAILSDIEAFFFIEAAQGDVRSNVLDAPKLTLFNGLPGQE